MLMKVVTIIIDALITFFYLQENLFIRYKWGKYLKVSYLNLRVNLFTQYIAIQIIGIKTTLI